MALDKWERQHRNDMARYEQQITKIYEAAVREAAALGISITDLTDDLFSFDRFPIARERMDRLLADLGSRVETCIVDGVNSQWTLANNKNSELCRMVFGDAVNRLTKEQQRRYFTNNDAARDAFLARKAGGLGLSGRVWNYTDLFRNEVELGLDVGIRSGLDAGSMARELKQYLAHPDMLFRRVRDEHGQLVLSLAAAAFHPGQGVYRSSYMNARRLAATETNIAYRTADYLRYQNLDFVVGVEVHLSQNHNCKGVPAGTFYDICDELNGKYPKDFKFTGWHPHCRCYVTTILKTDNELEADRARIMDGKEPTLGSVNTVSDVPQGFNSWIKDNAERAKHHNTIPYFVSDNSKYVPDAFVKDYGKLAIPITWKDDFARVRGEISESELGLITKLAQSRNHKALEKQLDIEQGAAMNFNQADGHKVNPHYGEERQYAVNCQTCTIAYELRRRGFNVESMGNNNGEVWKVVNSSIETFKTPLGLDADYTMFSLTDSRVRYTAGTSMKKHFNEFVDTYTEDNGRYEIVLRWKRGGAHVVTVEKRNGLLIWYDPQTGRYGDRLFNNAEEDILDAADIIGIRRMDDKVINRKMFERLLKKKKRK